MIFIQLRSKVKVTVAQVVRYNININMHSHTKFEIVTSDYERDMLGHSDLNSM